MNNEQLSLFPKYESESTSLAMKIFSEFCCDGCSCKSSRDHVAWINFGLCYQTKTLDS